MYVKTVKNQPTSGFKSINTVSPLLRSEKCYLAVVASLLQRRSGLVRKRGHVSSLEDLVIFLRLPQLDVGLRASAAQLLSLERKISVITAGKMSFWLLFLYLAACSTCRLTLASLPWFLNWFSRAMFSDIFGLSPQSSAAPRRSVMAFISGTKQRKPKCYRTRMRNNVQLTAARSFFHISNRVYCCFPATSLKDRQVLLFLSSKTKVKVQELYKYTKDSQFVVLTSSPGESAVIGNALQTFKFLPSKRPDWSVQANASGGDFSLARSKENHIADRK